MNWLKIVSTLLLTIQAMGENSLETSLVTIENEQLEVAVNPIGAELFNVRSKHSGREYLWQGDPRFWADRAPIMFPVVVRFKHDGFNYEDKFYSHPKLGLAFGRLFEVLPSKTDNEVSFILRSDAETLKRFPFPFEFEVSFLLEGNRLVNEFIVRNTGDKKMYYELGGHPGFSFPLSDTVSREDIEFVFSEKMSVDRPIVSNNLIHAGRVPFLDGESRLGLGDERVPNGGMFLENCSSKVIGLAIKGEEPFVSLDLGDFPHVNLWSPPEPAGRAYACIEPLVGHHDMHDSPMDITEKKSILTLEAGKSRVYRFTVIIHQ